ncbi:MAG: hypothetical protein OXH09_01450 [Gammaproteobacteria bacterium]|nr:hypothetical protein [Gammaproteobacteria bacterium]
MDLMNPCGAFDVKSTPLAPRIEFGPDATVGLFANDKKNADALLEHVGRGLRESHGVERFRWFRKEATQPAAFTDEFIAECHAVVGAVCD